MRTLMERIEEIMLLEMLRRELAAEKEAVRILNIDLDMQRKLADKAEEQNKRIKKLMVDGILKDHDSCHIHLDEVYTKLETKYFALEAENATYKEENEVLLKKLERSNDAWLEEKKENARLKNRLKAGEK